MNGYFVHLFLASVLAVPLPAVASYHNSGAPGRSELAPGRQRQATTTIVSPSPSPEVSPSPSPIAESGGLRRGKLRKPEHAGRLERVRGIVNGMTQKLTNLSARLDTHLQNFERRIAALEAAGHTITVETELAAARAAVVTIQASITEVLAQLTVLSDSETPRQEAQKVRSLVRGLRTQLRAVQAAFQALRQAIRDDVRAGAAASPSPSPSPTVSPSPTSLFGSPTPTPTLVPISTFTP